MVTVGRGLLDGAAFEFFDGMRSFDAKRASAVLSDDAAFESPWSGPLAGKARIQEFLQAFLADPVQRPSFTIIDVAGDGAIIRLKVSVSGRFGKAPEHYQLGLLVLQHKVHQVSFKALGKPAGH